MRELTGLPIQPYFSATKLAWLLDTVPGARSRAERGELAAGTIECWFAWNLTGATDDGAHVSDVTNASRTLLLDTEQLVWSDELLTLFGVPAAVLPTVVPTSQPDGQRSRAPTARSERRSRSSRRSVTSRRPSSARRALPLARQSARTAPVRSCS